jgi:hypothetical protein
MRTRDRAPLHSLAHAPTGYRFGPRARRLEAREHEQHRLEARHRIVQAPPLARRGAQQATHDGRRCGDFDGAATDGARRLHVAAAHDRGGGGVGREHTPEDVPEAPRILYIES